MIAAPPFFAAYQTLVNTELDRLIPDDGTMVSRSMAYTVRAPSKRVRPVLTLLAAELCGGTSGRAITAAAVMELVHASSLILDDLPSMDDAPLRRGQKANHLEFGEAIAILAAFGLLNLAYGTVARTYEQVISVRRFQNEAICAAPKRSQSHLPVTLRSHDQGVCGRAALPGPPHHLLTCSR